MLFSFIILYLISMHSLDMNWVRLLYANLCLKGVGNSKYKNYFLITRNYFQWSRAIYNVWHKRNDSETQVMNNKSRMRSPPTWEIREESSISAGHSWRTLRLRSIRGVLRQARCYGCKAQGSGWYSWAEGGAEDSSGSESWTGNLRPNCVEWRSLSH